MPELAEAKVVTGDGGEPPLSKGEVRKFKKLCQAVKDSVHLQAILNTVPFNRRRKAYDEIVPWLRFQAKPFEELRFF